MKFDLLTTDGGARRGQLQLAHGTVQTPSCEGDFVISYSGSCYEGCVKTSECGS